MRSTIYLYGTLLGINHRYGSVSMSGRWDGDDAAMPNADQVPSA
jgi:hypothetical protein